MSQTVRGMIVRGIKSIPLTHIPLTKHLVQELKAQMSAARLRLAIGWTLISLLPLYERTV